MPSLAVRCLHLGALWALAVVLPIFQLFDRSPDYLIANGNAWPDIPLVALGFLVLPPALMMLAELALLKFERASMLLHAGFVAALAAVFAFQVLKDSFDPDAGWLRLAAVGIGIAFALVYLRTRPVPMVLSVLAPVPLLVLVWFLAVSNVASFAWSTQTPDVETEEVRNRTPIVMVVFDEFSTLPLLDRRGRIDAARFPNFSELTKTGTWFPNATTVADLTTEAVPAIMSGKLDAQAQPIASDHPRNVFTLLRDQYPFHVHEPITNLCGCDKGDWPSRGRRLVSSIRDLVELRLKPGSDPEFLGLPPQTLIDRDDVMREWIDGVRPGLNFLHIELPHVPYQYLPTGRQYTRSTATEGITGEYWTKDGKVVWDALKRYRLQIGYVDRLVGRLVARLKATKMFERSLVILTADHGVAFRPGGPRRYVYAHLNLAEIGGVPLFVKAPGQQSGKIDEAWVRTTDVLPTIGDYLGLDWGKASLRRPVSRETVAVAAHFGPDVRVPVGEFEASRDEALLKLRSHLGTSTAAPSEPSRETKGYSLVERAGQPAIARGTGDPIRVTSGVARGYLDSADGGAIVGWATDSRARAPAELIVAFDGTRLVDAVRPTLQRDDLAEEFGRGAALAGFELRVPAGTDPSGLRVFAVVGNQASEIERGR